MAVLTNLKSPGVSQANVLANCKPVNNLADFSRVLRVIHRNGVFRKWRLSENGEDFGRETRIFAVSGK
jgi:hypothetical protein